MHKVVKYKSHAYYHSARSFQCWIYSSYSIYHTTIHAFCLHSIYFYLFFSLFFLIVRVLLYKKKPGIGIAIIHSSTYAQMRITYAVSVLKECAQKKHMVYKAKENGAKKNESYVKANKRHFEWVNMKEWASERDSKKKRTDGIGLCRLSSSSDRVNKPPATTTTKTWEQLNMEFFSFCVCN